MFYPLLCGSHWIWLRFLTCPCSWESPLPATRIVTLNSFSTWGPLGNLMKTMGSFPQKEKEEGGGGGGGRQGGGGGEMKNSCNFTVLTGSLKIIPKQSNTHIVVRVDMLGCWSWHWPMWLSKSLSLHLTWGPVWCTGSTLMSLVTWLFWYQRDHCFEQEAQMSILLLLFCSKQVWTSYKDCAPS